jgi:hypothetical protein
VDEIALLRAARPEVPDEFGEPERGEVLCRLLAAAAGERAGGKPMAAGRLRRASRRWRLRVAGPPTMTRRLGIAAAAAAATVATVGLVLAVWPAAAHTPASVQHPRASGRAPLPVPVFGTKNLTARPAQYIYTEQFVEGAESTVVNNRGTHIIKQPPSLLRTWASADGKRGITGTQRPLSHGTWPAVPPLESLCNPADPSDGLPHKICFPAYLPHLPGTVDGMRSYLLQLGGPNGPAAYKVLGGIINTSSASNLLVPNRSYHLMYRVALTVKGVYRVRHATTIAGTAGIGIAACVPAVIDKGSMPGFHGCPDRIELIFDATTYELIGVDHTNAQGKPNRFGEQALLDIAVVDKPGQLP